MSYEYAPIVETVANMSVHSADRHITFNTPVNVFSGNNGILYVLDTFNNMIHKMDSYGNVAPFAGNIAMIDDYTPLLDVSRLPMGFYHDGSLDDALFNRPVDGVKDAYGRIFIVDRSNHAIRVINVAVIYDNEINENRYTTSVFTLAGGNGAGYSNGFGLEATFYYPSAIAIDRDGNLYIADTGNNAIRRIDTNGYVTTVAGLVGVNGFRNGIAEESLFYHPMGIAVNENGTIFVADTGNHLIRSIEGNTVRTLAGMYRLPYPSFALGRQLRGVANYPLSGFADTEYGKDAMFSAPMGLALWNDILVVADSLNHAIRAILPNGEVLTIAGTGNPGYANGSLQEAMFHIPQGVYVFGNELIIVDTGNNLIRRIAQYNENAGISNE